MARNDPDAENLSHGGPEADCATRESLSAPLMPPRSPRPVTEGMTALRLKASTGVSMGHGHR